jgi:hypothetical protein
VKAIPGFVVVVASVLAACGALYDEGSAQANAPEQNLREQTATLAAGDCSVTIQCAYSSARTCSGTGGNCSANGSGYGSVTCNGTTTYCSPPPQPDCSANGICNLQCTNDPDCIQCVPGTFCTTNSHCGSGGVCISKSCRCSVSAE